MRQDVDHPALRLRGILSHQQTPRDPMQPASGRALTGNSMNSMDGKRRLEQIKALLEENPEETRTAILEFFKEEYGGTGFLMRTLAEESPEVFVRYALEADRRLGAPRVLEPKIIELVAVAASTALLCDHCLRAHIASAHTNGATWEEILDTILVAAHTSESSAVSVALRAFKQEQARHSTAREVEE
jgi:AhpD family alkylhydroperoxidase